jgi:hypothetical protein
MGMPATGKSVDVQLETPGLAPTKDGVKAFFRKG